MLLLGLAYKKNTGDARETPAARVAELLTRMGAEVRAADPHVVVGVHVPEPVIPGQRAAELDPHGDPFAAVRRVEATPEELAGADAVVLLADHDEFDYEAVTAHARYVLDCRHAALGRDGRGAVGPVGPRERGAGRPHPPGTAHKGSGPPRPR